MSSKSPAWHRQHLPPALQAPKCFSTDHCASSITVNTNTHTQAGSKNNQAGVSEPAPASRLGPSPRLQVPLQETGVGTGRGEGGRREGEARRDGSSLAFCLLDEVKGHPSRAARLHVALLDGTTSCHDSPQVQPQAAEPRDGSGSVHRCLDAPSPHASFIVIKCLLVPKPKKS